MVESDRAAWQALQANRETLAATAVTVMHADALEFLRHHQDCYHVVFLDPPFASDHWTQLLAGLSRLMHAGGLVYCESARALAAADGWQVVKSGRAGQVSHQLLKRAGHE